MITPRRYKHSNSKNNFKMSSIVPSSQNIIEQNIDLLDTLEEACAHPTEYKWKHAFGVAEVY